MAHLGVNIDHVATLRQARGTVYPEPAVAAGMAELGGAAQITIHLREDRRHIQDRDLEILRQTLTTGLNLEMAATDEMVKIACRTKPDEVCLVPEKREELTTEGGLDVAKNIKQITEATKLLKKSGIIVSLFIEPAPEQVAAAAETGAQAVELHTGRYADKSSAGARKELDRIIRAARQAYGLGLIVNAGHGLHYTNTAPIAAIPGIAMLNIGHSIIARAVLVGLQQATREMAEIVAKAS